MKQKLLIKFFLSLILSSYCFGSFLPDGYENFNWGTDKNELTKKLKDFNKFKRITISECSEELSSISNEKVKPKDKRMDVYEFSTLVSNEEDSKKLLFFENKLRGVCLKYPFSTSFLDLEKRIKTFVKDYGNPLEKKKINESGFNEMIYKWKNDTTIFILSIQTVSSDDMKLVFYYGHFYDKKFIDSLISEKK